jgi:hypothetical protein
MRGICGPEAVSPRTPSGCGRLMQGGAHLGLKPQAVVPDRSAVGGGALTFDYGYDRLNRLTTFTLSGDGTSGGTYGYDMDVYGNITAQTASTGDPKLSEGGCPISRGALLPQPGGVSLGSPAVGWRWNWMGARVPGS